MERSTDPRQEPWTIDVAEFRRLHSLQEKSRFLLRYAVLAPSSHNTQPWKFKPELEGIAVLLDPSKALPVADPQRREATIAVGAALFNLRVAAARFGLGCRIHVESQPGLPDLVARVHLLEDHPVDDDLLGLFGAIARRRTNRRPFRSQPLRADELERLRGVAGDSNIALRVVHDRGLQSELAALVAQGDRLQLADAAFRAELAAWVRPSHALAEDGIPSDSLGMPEVVSPLGAWVVRSVVQGEQRGRSDAHLARQAPALVTVCGEDTPAGWVDAGQVLQRLLLETTALGLQYGFLNQPIQVYDLRFELRDLLEARLWPQVLIRVGRGRPVRRATPRRRLEAVLMH